MMQREAIGDEVKGIVVERQRVRVGGAKFDVGDAAFVCQFARGVEHLRREVNGSDTRDVRRKLERSVSRAGGNIKRVPRRVRLCQFDESRQTCARGMYGARRILVRTCAELLLDSMIWVRHLLIADCESQIANCRLQIANCLCIRRGLDF